MFLSKTVLVRCRLEIFVDRGKNQSLQGFCDWAEKRDRPILLLLLSSIYIAQNSQINVL